jgi:integrase
LSALFSHAIRHELYQKINPIQSVRQGSKRLKIPELLSLDEIRAILHGIGPTAIRTAFLVAAVTALRRSEIRGLKWGDVDYERLWLNLARGKVRKHVTKMKTEASRKGIPIPQDLADALDAWRGESLYRSDDDWVFASPTTDGEQPIWLDMALKNHIRTAASAAGIRKTIGWHTARRSLASPLAAKGESIKVVQELLRHARSSTTTDLYQQADVDLKRAAQVHTNDLFLIQRRVS